MGGKRIVLAASDSESSNVPIPDHSFRPALPDLVKPPLPPALAD